MCAFSCWTQREWWRTLTEITLQGYHLPGPETKARLHHNDHLTPLPQRAWSTVALYLDGCIAEEDLVANKCHVASVFAPAVTNPDTDDDPGMTSEEESEDERVRNHYVRVARDHDNDRKSEQCCYKELRNRKISATEDSVD